MPGVSEARKIAGGNQHEYTVNLVAGQFLSLKVVKGDLNLSVKLLDPEGRLRLECLSRRFGPLPVSFVADISGPHRLEIRSLEDSSFVGDYEVDVEDVRSARAHDRKVAAAVNSLAAAENLRAGWQNESLLESVKHYLNAHQLWKAVGRKPEAAEALERIGEIYFILGKYPEALSFFDKALSLSRDAGDQQGEAQLLNDIGYVYVTMGENDQALIHFDRALNAYRQAASSGESSFQQRGEAQVTNNKGEVYYSRGELKMALRHFIQALEMWSALRDRRGQALAHLNLGYTYADSGDLPKALDNFRQTLSLWRATGERRGEALSETAIGTVFSFLGEKQIALDSHQRAMQIFRTIGDRSGEAVALNSIARAYEELNEPLTALDNYNLALKLHRENRNRDSEAVTLYYIGRLHHSQGSIAEALSFYNLSISLSRRKGKRRVEAYALLGVGAIHASTGDTAGALSNFTRVLEFYRDIGDRRGQAFALSNIGYTYYLSQDKQKALSYFKEALPLSRAADDRAEESLILYHIARSERDLNNLDESLARMEESTRISESLRTKVISPTLRTSYFASVHERYRFYLDLLMQTHRQRPNAGFAITALQISERARARSLLEMLAEGRVDIRQGVAPSLLERERTLQQLLNAKAEYKMRLSAQASDEEATEIAGELRQLTTEYEEVKSLIRDQSPQYAALTQTQILLVEDIQTELRDDDTLLLEYARGNEKTYLWLISRSSVQTFELTESARIEEMSREVYKLLTARHPIEGEPFQDYQRRVAEADRQYWERAAALSQILLGQVRDQIETKRLLIIADGALQYIPFEALPIPVRPASGQAADRQGTDNLNLLPLALEHEISYLPSATALATLRRQGRINPPEQKMLAIFADPVFNKSDPRLEKPDSMLTNSQAEALVAPEYRLALRSFAGGSMEISRLPFSLLEAKAIMGITPPGEAMLATGFEANRATVMRTELGHYRIIHFATHSIINDEHPEFSGILLSMVDKQGKQENGFLQLHDIYNLNLSSELVVLSACSTGLGKDIEGEGLVGLTRGFMYAGSRSIIASLWKVDDRATAELMEHFYRAMLQDGLPPAAALRAAKVAMWKQERWKSPYYWAAFVLQGEYAERGSDVSARPHFIPVIIALIVALLLGAIGVYKFRRRRGETFGARNRDA
jgi:tetratricopeptide (TPR) repeat protein